VIAAKPDDLAEPLTLAQMNAPVGEDVGDEPPPVRRHPRRYYETPQPYPPPPPPGMLYEPYQQRAIPCLPTLLTLGFIRWCI
jgi:hypothetical protein